MPPVQPDGIEWPKDGHLDPALAEVDQGRPLSLYVHVPFCTIRCGYCDFNTYTTGFGVGAEPGSYARSIEAEAQFGRRALVNAGFEPRPAETVFIGGGTPTLLDTDELAHILDSLRNHFGIAQQAELTIEANPDSIDAKGLLKLKEAGVTRVSFGMQSAVPQVLATLDRTHNPQKVPSAVQAARDAGLDVSVDLIYGAPGESIDDWHRSLDTAVALETDHISAYALVIEKGTKMGVQVARGELPMPDPDDEATKYELADQVLTNAGFKWYEISNFARPDVNEAGVEPTELRHASRHNLAYWRDWDWWGLGPGAHSHVGRYRWWNVKHPTAYAGRVQAGVSPALAGEILQSDARALEKVMLAVRTSEGIRTSDVINIHALPGLIADQLIDGVNALKGRVVLTLKGRLLADYVTRELMGF